MVSRLKKIEDCLTYEDEAKQQALAEAIEKLKKCMKRHIRKSELLKNWYVVVRRNAVLCRPLIMLDDPNQRKIADFASLGINLKTRTGKDK